MSAIDDHYPPMPCAFCKISEAYPSSPTSPVPDSPDPEKLAPQCHLILSAPHVLAFLDIMPIAAGHMLLTTRQHYTKLSDLHGTATTTTTTPAAAADDARAAARALGEWLPVLSRALCRVTGIEDWNVVQNNGERAAQVVPHIHFHLIPRYQEHRRPPARNGKVDVGMLKSWTMFGRGAREDLDDDEGRDLAARLRAAIEEELVGEGGGRKVDAKL